MSNEPPLGVVFLLALFSYSLKNYNRVVIGGLVDEI